MALTAVLEFGDNYIRRYSKQYLVSDCHFVFNRQFNSYRPEGGPRCERIEIVVVAPGRDDLSLFQWFSSQEVRAGRIVIMLSGDGRTTEGETQMLYFEEAKCFSLSEMYDINSSRRRLLKLALIADSITIDEVSFRY